MNDERGPKPERAASGPTPNRGRPRAPTTIDARAVNAQTFAPGGAPEPAAPQPPEPDTPGLNIEPRADIRETPGAAPASGDPASPIAAQEASAPSGTLANDERVADRPAQAGRAPLLPVAAASLGAAALSALAVYLLAPSAPGLDPQAVTRLDQRTAALESRLEAVAARPAPQPTGDLERRLAGAEAQVKSALEQARAAMGQSEKAISQSAAPAAVAPLEARLSALEKAIAAKPAGDAGPALASLEGRLKEIERTLAAPKADTRAMETRLEPAAAPAPPVDIAPLEKRLADLEAKVSPLEARIAPLAPALAELRAAVDAGLAKAAQAQAQAADAALAQSQGLLAPAQALIAQAALVKLDAGEPFAQEIDALARLGQPVPQVDPLRELAPKGAATIPALAREFSGLEPRLIGEPKPASEASVFDRLAQSATALVRVRPVGEPTGDSPASLVVRIERALAARDLGGALAAWEQLPEGAKSVSADWAGRARARLVAEQALRAMASDAIARLGKLKS